MQGEPTDEALFAELSERLRVVNRRIGALPLDDDGKARVVRRLLAVTNLAKHDLRRASARLDALVTDLDAGRAPAEDGDDQES